MKRDIHQHRDYAVRRSSLTVDRLILATLQADQDKVCQWAAAWGVLGGLPCRAVA
jgi:hypothetical protein